MKGEALKAALNFQAEREHHCMDHVLQFEIILKLQNSFTVCSENCTSSKLKRVFGYPALKRLKSKVSSSKSGDPQDPAALKLFWPKLFD